MAPGGSLNSDSASNNPNEAVLPEKEEYKIELKKDGNGLGITIAGYVCEKGRETQKYFLYSKNIAVGLKYAVSIIHRFWKRSFPLVRNSFSSIFELGSMNFSEKTAKDISPFYTVKQIKDFPLKDTKVLQF